MASLQVHCNDCVKRLGKPYKHVHRYLDQYARNFKGSKLHRYILHNKRGIEKVRRRWGNEAAEAAKIHIWRDKQDRFDFLKY